MIALSNNLPVVRFEDGEIIEFDRHWLCGLLGTAATRAGYQKWWLAPHVTLSVANYLEQDFNRPTIGISELEKAVRSVLQVIGYADVADQFAVTPPPARISLEEIARDAGHAYELGFFKLLRSRVREALETRQGRVEICDARRGIKLLRRAKSWSRDCSGLLEEVVTVVRGEAGHLRDAAVQIQFK